MRRAFALASEDPPARGVASATILLDDCTYLPPNEVGALHGPGVCFLLIVLYLLRLVMHNVRHTITRRKEYYYAATETPTGLQALG